MQRLATGSRAEIQHALTSLGLHARRHHLAGRVLHGGEAFGDHGAKMPLAALDDQGVGALALTRRDAFGSEPLEAGFRRWNWSRARLGDRTVVLYDSERRDGSRGAITRSFAADGELAGFALPQPVDLGRTRWGIDRATRCDAGGRARVVRSLEDTPFYARSEIVAEIGGASVAAVHESLDLDRFARPLIQHMLTYRIRREGLR